MRCIGIMKINNNIEREPGNGWAIVMRMRMMIMMIKRRRNTFIIDIVQSCRDGEYRERLRKLRFDRLRDVGRMLLRGSSPSTRIGFFPGRWVDFDVFYTHRRILKFRTEYYGGLLKIRIKKCTYSIQKS